MTPTRVCLLLPKHFFNRLIEPMVLSRQLVWIVIGLLLVLFFASCSEDSLALFLVTCTSISTAKGCINGIPNIPSIMSAFCATNDRTDDAIYGKVSSVNNEYNFGSKYYCDLLNGIKVEFSVSSTNDIELALKYDGKKNTLQWPGVKVIPQASTRPIQKFDKVSRKTTFEFYDKPSGTKFVLEVPFAYKIFEVLFQLNAHGWIPGEIGQIMVFSQKNEIFVVKKLSETECTLLKIPSNCNTSNFKISKSKRLRHRGPLHAHQKEYNIIFCSFFLTTLALIARWSLLNKKNRKSRLAKLKRNEKALKKAIQNL